MSWLQRRSQPRLLFVLALALAVAAGAVLFGRSGPQPVAHLVVAGPDAGQYASMAYPRVGEPFAVWLTIRVARPYSRVVFTGVHWASISPTRGVRLVHAILTRDSQTYYISVGWPPVVPPHFRSTPVSGRVLRGAVLRRGPRGASIVLVYNFAVRGLYRFDDPTVTGTAYKTLSGRDVAVAFSQTFHNDHWGYCLGYRIPACDRKRTDAWISG